ncbi:DUF2726 domain-containing protein (plasmid) [Erythrobacteraceae bacterium WH01K]|nr:DUF2726 domain-containing protein [Erythrobacteraceae bacterium WH01K]
MDSQFLLIVVIAGVVIATFAILNSLPKRQLSQLKARPKPLMTPAERRVCLMIERAMPGARVHSQVSMGAIMNPANGLSKSEWWTTFNKFSSKRVDFLVEDPHSGRIILLVELDDRSHDRRSDTDRDALTRHAGYTTVRLPAGERPTQTSVERHIEAALGPAFPHPAQSPWQATQT